MKFSISIDTTKKNTTTSVGSIVLDDFEEKFEASLSYWNELDYMIHWINSLKSIVDGNQKSALISSMFDPNDSTYIFIWSMYRIGSKVMFQNKIIFLEELVQPLSIKNFDVYVPEREVFTEDGDKISEWDIELNAIKEFLSKKLL